MTYTLNFFPVHKAHTQSTLRAVHRLMRDVFLYNLILERRNPRLFVLLATLDHDIQDLVAN